MEYTIFGYVARDKDDNLYIYDKLPKRDRKNGIWQVNEKFVKFYQLPKEWFPETTWTSEPLLIDVTFNS